MGKGKNDKGLFACCAGCFAVCKLHKDDMAVQNMQPCILDSLLHKIVGSCEENETSVHIISKMFVI